LNDVRIDERSSSGRAARLRLPGLRPDVIAGDAFRAALGTTVLRSTVFSVERSGGGVRFTGRGFGHGVGMCVIGAGRRAARGDTMEAILAQYYPGLELTRLDRRTIAPRTRVPLSENGSAAAETRGSPAVSPTRRAGILVSTGPSPVVAPPEVERLATRAHADLSKVLGLSVSPISIRVHESLESFRLATGRPWWVGSVSEGTSIDLAPPSLLGQREGFDTALRIAIADLLLSKSLAGRPLWIRAGAARYFARQPAVPLVAPQSREGCPSDVDLTLAVSAAAQRAAESRAEACFVRALAAAGDWRAVK
jgi:hypothetical protein